MDPTSDELSRLIILFIGSDKIGQTINNKGETVSINLGKKENSKSTYNELDNYLTKIIKYPQSKRGRKIIGVERVDKRSYLRSSINNRLNFLIKKQYIEIVRTKRPYLYRLTKLGEKARFILFSHEKNRNEIECKIRSLFIKNSKLAREYVPLVFGTSRPLTGFNNEKKRIAELTFLVTDPKEVEIIEKGMNSRFALKNNTIFRKNLVMLQKLCLLMYCETAFNTRVQETLNSFLQELSESKKFDLLSYLLKSYDYL